MNMATFAHAYAMKERLSASLLKHPHIHGVGVGFWDKKQPKRGAAVIIYSNLISVTLLGIRPTVSLQRKNRNVVVPLRVVKTGRVHSHTDYKRRIRPVPAGYSVGTRAGAGTVGLIVKNALSHNQLYILSNNHVLTNPVNIRHRAATLQPGGTGDQGAMMDGVGYLSRYVRLRKNSSNLVDVALSTPVSNSILSPRYATVGTVPGHVTAYRVGERLKKVGRTTGLRYGTVESVNTDMLVGYGGRLGTLLFRNQTVIRGPRPVSRPGDSGSVWLRRKDNFAAAVNFAGTDDGRISIAFPVDWAMKRFQIRVAQPKAMGHVRTVKSNSLAYSRHLTAKELRSIQVIRVQR